jgi:hypothetical protein
MFEAHIEANMYDEDTAQFLSQDSGWLQAQWPEARRQAVDAGKTVTGNPSLKGYNFKEEAEDGILYDFVFNVPTN